MISEIVKMASWVFNVFKEKRNAAKDLKLAEVEAKKKIMLSDTQANTAWELAQLSDKDKYLRWAAFLLFSSPLIACLISPEWGVRVKEAWGQLPEWQANVLSGMCLAVFGLKKIPHLVGATVRAVKDGWKG